MAGVQQAPLSQNGESRRTVQSVDRACAILQFLELETNGCTTSEVGRHLGVHKSTASRLLAALESAGIVVRDPLTNRFQLGLRIVTLTGSILSRLDVLRISEPLLRRLAETTQETVNLGVRFGNEVVNVGQIPSQYIRRSYDWIGESAPLHQGALARALLAHLDRAETEVYLATANAEGAALKPVEFWSAIEQIRQQGYAINRGELSPDVYAVGAPIFDRRGQCCAGVAVAGHSERFGEEQIPALISQVVETAATISHQLGYSIGWNAAGI